MNKMLMEENDRLQKQVSHLVYENRYTRQQIHTLRRPWQSRVPWYGYWNCCQLVQMIGKKIYAPTTLASARDSWTLRYITSLDDGSLVICERSLTLTTGGPTGPPSTCFVRAEMLPSGYLIRPCEGGGSIIQNSDHFDFDVCSRGLCVTYGELHKKPMARYSLAGAANRLSVEH
ncbi:homeobox-leucine zipper protein athb-9 [Phtheirospermum japonicum]|uniref:Homeobox-leucine zipper protein athb-9 n=1 Tax=Phtheirospermum japonicum TaxID=374723 RepID=A0A830CIS9_9LAMI|nr:homeobox-leucine zipper protein athb-9 [Phtheirospermum japonicum]